MVKVDKPVSRKEYKSSKCEENLKEDELEKDEPTQGRRMGIYEARALFDGHPRPKFVGN